MNDFPARNSLSSVALSGIGLATAKHILRSGGSSPAIVQTSIYEGFMAKEDIPGAMKALESFHPLGRVGTPEDVANTIVFLPSDKTSWVTGAIWNVDAGVMAVRK